MSRALAPDEGEEERLEPGPERSDSDLVASARTGDDDAFAELWRRHAAAGRTVARSFTDADPDDVVSEAYVRILTAVREGGGPTAGFRPYLFTTIRNVASSWGAARREVGIEDATTIEDPASTEAASMDALDRSLTARAFRSLPERWQEVLWYTEVERMTPAAAAPLLGLTANGVAALAYRAREGLRQAWIQAHIAASPEGSEHRWVTERLGAYSRGGLGKRDTARMDRHLAECAKCGIVAAEAANVGSHLGLVLLPLLLGVGGAAAYAASIQHGATATAAAATGAVGVSGASGVSGVSQAAAAGTAARRAARAGRNGMRGGAIAGASVAGVLVAAGVAGAVVLGPQLFAEPRSGGVAAAGRSSAPDASAAEPPARTTVPPAAPSPAPSAPPAVPTPPGEDDADAPDEAPPADEPSPPVVTEPVVTVPSAPAVPPAPPVTPPVTPPVKPPVPAAPVLTTAPAPGFTTADRTLALAGTGIPGAAIAVVPSPSPSATAALTARTAAASIGSATVGADGTWSLTADLSSLADGSWTLSVTQTTAGGTSTAATATVTIDRTALAPVVTSVDTGSGATAGLLAPVLTGTAEPGATVRFFDHGTLLATVQADEQGGWTSPELIAIPADYSLTAQQTDRLGNVSPDSIPVTGTATVATVSATGAPGLVTVTVQGIPGSQAQVWADGKASPYTLTLDASGAASQTYTWTAGDHRIGVTYLFGARHGVLADVPVTLP